MKSGRLPNVQAPESTPDDGPISPETSRALPRNGELNSAFGSRDCLLRILRHPDEMWDLSLKAWEAVMPQARFAGVWPQIAAQVRRQGRQADVPPPVWRQMEAALRVADVHANNYRWEVSRLQRAFSDVSCPLILLKGAAFLCSEMPWAEGRSFQDIDVLVPQERLPEVESALRQHGWVDSVTNRLDAMYFRQWLQELAPMWHPDRKIQVDLHHSIIPPRDRLRFDPSPLFEDAVPISGSVRTLSPIDMVLHATSNLFWTGEFTFILSELYDMHAMLRVFSQSPQFWPKLVARAEQLNLTRPLYFAIRYLREVFELDVPSDVLTAAERWRPGWLTLKFVDFLVHRTLFPASLDEIDETRNFALILREYWAVPRLGVLFTGVFWLKRLPTWLLVWFGLHTPESTEPPPRNTLIP